MGQELYEALLEYSGGDDYPFHMPGHKRQMHLMEDLYAVDITEIDGFDNLHHAEGILLEAQERAAQLYGSEETHYLINGSTSGLLAAVAASVRRGGRILVARNCHKAVYHAVLLQGLHVSWLYPDIDLQRGIYGSIRPDQMEQALLDAEQSGGQMEAVVVTSPTFDGVVSDIRGIARIVHAHGAVLIVDEAHGAHFAMHPYFPESAVACGADLVINSVHKTLPAMTQTALIHVNGTRVDRIRLRRYLDIFQSSSPSYVLMAGIDRCICLMMERRQELYDTFICRLEQLRERLSHFCSLHLITGEETEFPCFAYDRSRLVVSTERSGISGQELYQMLRETYHLQPEMAAEYYVILITTVADTQEGLERLGDALEEIDTQISERRATDEKYRGVESERQAADAKCRGAESGRWASDTKCRGAESGRWASDTKCRGAETERRAADAKRCGAESEQIMCITQEYGADTPCRRQTWLHNEEAMSMEAAADGETYEAELSQSAGCVSAEYIYLYPPGIPLLIPGERISRQLLDRLGSYRRQGLSLQGLADYTGEKIRLVREMDR